MSEAAGAGHAMPRDAPRVPAVLVDVALPVALLGLNFLNLDQRNGDDRVPLAADVLLLIAQTAPLIVRRRFPGTVLAVTVTALAVRLWLHLHLNAAAVGLALAIYAVGAYGSQRTRAAAVVTTALSLLGGAVLAAIPSQLAYHQVVAFVPGVAYGLALLTGVTLRARRHYVAALEQRAHWLEVQREQRARQAVAQERARIARELHDVIAHHVSAISVQARAVQSSVRSRPARAEEALHAIVAASDLALLEMRQLLGILREDREDREDSEDSEWHELAPQQTLADVRSLAEECRAAGMAVDCEQAGERRDIPLLVSVSAYRIIREALTNARRHSDNPRVSVTIRYNPADLEIELVNTGARDQVPAAGGFGLLGMRERAALLGGEFTADAQPGGRYRVFARLPYAGVAR
jgi:signal transduction histidine kinase